MVTKQSRESLSNPKINIVTLVFESYKTPCEVKSQTNAKNNVQQI